MNDLQLTCNCEISDSRVTSQTSDFLYVSVLMIRISFFYTYNKWITITSKQHFEWLESNKPSKKFLVCALTIRISSFYSIMQNIMRTKFQKYRYDKTGARASLREYLSTDSHNAKVTGFRAVPVTLLTAPKTKPNCLFGEGRHYEKHASRYSSLHESKHRVLNPDNHVARYSGNSHRRMHDW
jgi:hypothetical protein